MQDDITIASPPASKSLCRCGCGRVLRSAINKTGFYSNGAKNIHCVRKPSNRLCYCGCGEYLSFRSGSDYRRGHLPWSTSRRITQYDAARHGNPSIVRPTAIDIAWAAGFLEGEGSFSLTHRTSVCCISQVQREPLERMVKFFGGSIYPHGQRNILKWKVTGPRAMGIMLTVFDFMSPRRKGQIRASLGL